MTEDHGNLYFNEFIDDWPQVLFFELDELIPFLVLFFLGLQIDMLYTMGLIGTFFVFLLRKMKTSSVDGIMQRFLYWHGFGFVIGITGEPMCHERIFNE